MPAGSMCCRACQSQIQSSGPRSGAWPERRSPRTQAFWMTPKRSHCSTKRSTRMTSWHSIGASSSICTIPISNISTTIARINGRRIACSVSESGPSSRNTWGPATTAVRRSRKGPPRKRMMGPRWITIPDGEHGRFAPRRPGTRNAAALAALTMTRTRCWPQTRTSSPSAGAGTPGSRRTGSGLTAVYGPAVTMDSSRMWKRSRSRRLQQRRWTRTLAPVLGAGLAGGPGSPNSDQMTLQAHHHLGAAGTTTLPQTRELGRGRTQRWCGRIMKRQRC
mmetsp:Transcript_46623/g.83418  ORF Transcript_46623/g.83418 Transcript_46623/m.83418 type:complete len:277 (+) Transcript_46623:4312-5142(+)